MESKEENSFKIVSSEINKIKASNMTTEEKNALKAYLDRQGIIFENNTNILTKLNLNLIKPPELDREYQLKLFYLYSLQIDNGKS